MPSLRIIAQNLGISITTVSRGLAGYSDVSAATRERIATEALRLGYVPNEMARRLQKQQSGIIGMVVVIGLFDREPSFLGTIAEIAGALNGQGYDLVLSTVQSLEEARSAYERLNSSRRVDGFLAYPMHCDGSVFDYVRAQNLPFVLLDGNPDPGTVPHLIDGGLSAASQMALDLLKAHGHRRIGYLTSHLSGAFFARRREIVQGQALRLGLDLVAVPARLDEFGGRDVGRRIKEGLDITALVTPTGRPCVGLSIELEASGIVIGRDLSLVALGDHPLLAEIAPGGVTAVVPNLVAFAHRAVECVLAQCRREPDLPPVVSVEPRLVERGSVGPAPYRTRNASA
jgi:LacI family transcriptional regulator